MVENPYLYVLLIYDQDGKSLGQVPADADWAPACEWARFELFRNGAQPSEGGFSSVSIEPLWDSKRGEPYVRGFEACIARNGCGEARAEFPLGYFGSCASAASSYFVKQGKLKEGDDFTYRVAAFRQDAPREAPPAARFQAAEVDTSPPVGEADLEALARRSLPAGTIDADDMPVFIPREVLAEVEAGAVAGGADEAGGVLLGRLYRAAESRQLFAEVKAQVPAGARGTSTKLTFEPETWTAVAAAIRLRGRGEIYLGYWHSHPVQEWCKDKVCSPEKLRRCSLANAFFSESDQAVLRAVFPRAYSLGLVCANTPLGTRLHSLFGWRRGMVEQRGYYILGGSDAR